MNKIKHLFICAFVITALSGCGSSKSVSNNILLKETAPLYSKKKTLTEEDLKRWSHLDLEKDTIPGMSVDRAYNELLKNKKSIKVIVGVIDSGVDIEHEDLKSIIWTNPNEIAKNGIDDDKNGYVDDIHGWNFLGDSTKENFEYERIIANKSLVDDATYQKAMTISSANTAKATSKKKQLQQMLAETVYADAVLIKHLGKSVYSLKEVNAIAAQDAEIIKSKAIMQKMFSLGLNVPEFKETIQKEIDKPDSALTGNNLKTDYRKIVGDNPDDITDTKYGNNNVMGPDKQEILHGTHVAGIIAQVRNNKLGGDGIANNVAIMTVRAAPNGDEYDKDIALGIRYAVDNGAKVINGSFGKAVSPHKQWVYDAIKYAESKDVLIVMAAGNDAKNVDVEDVFPRDSDDKKTEFANNTITIGALNYKYGTNMIAPFSNYGKINVDVFAPGMSIYATTPNDSYKYLQGTSMASPNVAGVAALIRSYYPTLSAQQVKHILIHSGIAITTNVSVGGNSANLISFSSICKSGKIVNAYNALIMAEKLSKTK